MVDNIEDTRDGIKALEAQIAKLEANLDIKRRRLEIIKEQDSIMFTKHDDYEYRKTSKFAETVRDELIADIEEYLVMHQINLEGGKAKLTDAKLKLEELENKNG